MKARALLIAVSTLVVFCVNSFAATGGVDNTYDAVPSLALTSSDAPRQVVQPDGKVIVYGIKGVVSGIARGDIFRLNADGTPDATFTYCGCVFTSIGSILLAPDGKLIVAGFDAGGARMARLNMDGSVDPGFSVFAASTFFGGTDFTPNAIQTDGKLLATRRDSFQGHVSYGLVRYNTDGSVDSTFTAISLGSGSPINALPIVKILPNGMFYLANTITGLGSSAEIKRYNAAGSVDQNFESPTFSGPGGFPPGMIINDIDVAADGSVVVAGRWDSVNGLNRPNLIRLLPAGNVDLNFNPPALAAATGVKILANGKVLVSAAGTLLRLNTDGSVDNTFTMSPAVVSILNGWKLDGASRIIFFGQRTTGTPRFIRLMPDGSLDDTFDPDVTRFGQVYALARQADGKVLVAGVFSQFNGVTRQSLVRTNADGTLDLTFNAGAGFAGQPVKLLIQPDGKILAIGEFNSYNGDPVQGLVRINADGSRDTTFNITHGGGASIYGLSLQADGKILISGSFSSVNGANRTYVARLSSDGTVDASFNPTIGCCAVYQVEADAGGKVMIAGGFTGINGFNRTYLARLNGDGALDQSFTATNTGQINKLWLQPDGKYLYSPFSGLARRNNDGSSDTSFMAPTFAANNGSDLAINWVVIQPDGSILVGGRFDTVGTSSRRNLARLSNTGELDLLFLPNGTTGAVRAVIDYPSGKAMIGGDFSRVEKTVKDAVARILVPAFTNATPFDFDGDGRADISVTRPDSAYTWYQLLGPNYSFSQTTFGQTGDIVTPADFDGDGVTDIAIFRNGDWWWKSSLDGGQHSVHWGASGDIPLPGDIDADGKTDFVVYRNGTWYRTVNGGNSSSVVFGAAGDKPLVADFDGDGKVDPTIFRPSTGTFWYAASTLGGAHRAVQWGISTDVPVVADYDGDGKSDFAVYRPAEGA